jgi:hypothetical protein
MNKLLLSLVLLIGVAPCTSIAETDGSKALPPGSTLACEQSLDDFGGPDRKPSWIHWRSYSVRLDVSAVAKFYEQRFGRPQDPGGDRGLVWKLADGLTYAIYPVTSSASWLECMKNREDISAVILVVEAGPKTSSELATVHQPP